MTAVLTRAQMMGLDRIAIDDVGIPTAVLMEVAGRAVADAIPEQSGAILVVAGTGNNGGDAVVAARHLAERGARVELVVLGAREKLSADLMAQLAIAERLGLSAILLEGDAAPAALAQLAEHCTLAIDGIFGTGLDRPIEGWRREVIGVLGGDELEVVSIDIPSGIDADTGQVLGRAVHADLTVTFQFPKLGHFLYPGRAHAGELVVADIGIPPSRLSQVAPLAELVGPEAVRAAFPLRAADSHKGTYGHLLVVAGEPDRPGSALLAARAALRVGTGLVTLGSDRETIARLAAGFGEVMGLTLGELRPEADRITRALAERRTALAIGPSLPPDASTKALLKAVLTGARAPAVLDAGGLASLAGDYAWLADRPGATVITPHPGEMAALVGLDVPAVQANRVEVARQVARESGAHVVLKGASTVVAHPDGRVGFVLDGNPGMSTGGMGDVLAGVIGGLLAQGVEPGLAAQAGAKIHAEAADRAAAEVGEAGLVASDVVDALARAIRSRVEVAEV